MDWNQMKLKLRAKNSIASYIPDAGRAPKLCIHDGCLQKSCKSQLRACASVHDGWWFLGSFSRADSLSTPFSWALFSLHRYDWFLGPWSRSILQIHPKAQMHCLTINYNYTTKKSLMEVVLKLRSMNFVPINSIVIYTVRFRRIQYFVFWEQQKKIILFR